MQIIELNRSCASVLYYYIHIMCSIVVVGIEEKDETEGGVFEKTEFSEAGVVDEGFKEGTVETDFSVTKAVKKIGKGTAGRVTRAVRTVSSSLRRKK